MEILVYGTVMIAYVAVALLAIIVLYWFLLNIGIDIVKFIKSVVAKRRKGND